MQRKSRYRLDPTARGVLEVTRGGGVRGPHSIVASGGRIAGPKDEERGEGKV